MFYIDKKTVWIFFVLIFFTVSYGAETETGDYIHYRLAVKYKNEKKYSAAIDEFRKVLAAYPDNYNAYMHIAEIRAAEDQPRLVIYNLKKALNYNPGWGKAHKLLADAYEKNGQYQKAIMELQQYQQNSDPAEVDSLQLQIDRLIRRVSGEGEKVADDKTIDSAGSAEKSGAVIDSGVNETKVVKLPAAVATEAKNVSESKKKDDDAILLENKTKSKPDAPVGGNAFTKAVTAYNENKYDESLSLLREVLKSNPGHDGAYYYAGLVRLKMGQNKMAKINFLKAITFPEVGHNAHFYLGKLFGEEKNYTEAIRQLNFYIAKTQYDVGKKEAISLIDAYKRSISPETLDSVMKVGVAITPVVVPSAPIQVIVPAEKYSQIEIRIDSLLSMLTVDTLSDLGVKLLDGIKMFKAGQYDESIKAFRNVLAAKPGGAEAMNCTYNTGVCYFKLGLYKEAENQFQQILERFPGETVAAQSLFLKALTYLQRDEPGVAEKLFRKFIQEHRHHSWSAKAFELLGDSYVDLDQHKKAIDSYTQAAANGTGGKIDRVFALFKLGNTYLHIGNKTRAIEAYKSAIDIGEKNDVFVRVPDSYYRIADEYYKTKEYKSALEYYTHVTRKYPAFQETPWGLFQIGSIYKNLMQYQNAVKTFKDLIKQYPEDYWAKQAQWKLEDSIWENEYKAVLRK